MEYFKHMVSDIRNNGAESNHRRHDRLEESLKEEGCLKEVD